MDASERLNKFALVIDDDAVFRTSLAMMLRICGFNQVETAPDGELGLRMMSRWSYDLVMCDWNMEPIDGLEVLRQVKGCATMRSTPFILMTASLSEVAWRGALEAGANDFLVKPFDLNSLRKTCRLLEGPQRPVDGDNVIPLLRQAVLT